MASPQQALYSRTGSRRLSENRSRRERKLVRVRFFRDLRRILVIFNENHGKIWPNPAFSQQALYSRTAS